MTREQWAQRIVDGAANAVHLQSGRHNGLEFLWSIGLMGGADELEALEGAIRSAVQSELESFAKAHGK